MLYEEKAKNSKLKVKNDENLGFDDLLDGGYDESDDRYVRGNRVFHEGIDSVGELVRASMKYPFEGAESFPRAATMAAVSLIPVIGSMAASGYGVRVMRRTLRGQSNLPEWNDFGGDLKRGFTTWFGGFFLSVLLALSMIAVVTIPIVLLFGFPMVAYAMCRYAATEDFSVFFDITGAYRYVVGNLWTSLLVTISAVIMGIIWGIAISIGFAVFFLPGLFLSAASIISFNYLMALWGRKVGLEG